jgi:hypothetical protein
MSKIIFKIINLQVLLPQCMSMAEMDDMYRLDALPIAKSAGIEQVCRTLWQPLPTYHILAIRQKNQTYKNNTSVE